MGSRIASPYPEPSDLVLPEYNEVRGRLCFVDIVLVKCRRPGHKVVEAHGNLLETLYTGLVAVSNRLRWSRGRHN